MAAAAQAKGRRGSRGVRWLRAVATGLAALGVASLGFTLGLAVGLAVEDPALIFQHLLGQTLVVPIDRDSARAQPPAAVSSRGRLAPRPSRDPTQAQPPARSTRPASRGHFAIQVGAFSDAPSAQRLLTRLERHGFRAYVSASPPERPTRWRVRVGPLASRLEAERLETRLKREEGLPTWVVREEPR